MTFAWRCESRDGAARAGRLLTAHGEVETPVFMPVGTAGTVKAMTVGRGARDRRAHDPRQHLSPHAAPRCRAGGAAWRPAPDHGLARPDPDRFRRLPGDVARQPAHARCRRGHFPFAHRRCAAPADAGTFRRDPARPRRHHHHGVRRMHAVPRDRGTGPRQHGTVHALGRALPRRVRAARRLRAVRHRSGRRVPRPARALGGGAGAHRLRRLRDRRAGGRRGPGGHVRRAGRSGAATARGGAALPDGRRHAGRHSRGGRARHRHVRLRDPDARRPHRARLHATRRVQPAQRPLRRRRPPARPRLRLPRCARGTRAPTCIICSAARRCWGRCC